jgi:O-antigen/teichoic acid export membrane protein
VLLLTGGGLTEVFLAKALARLVQFAVLTAFVVGRMIRVSLRAPRSVYRMFLVEGLPLEISEFLQMLFFKIDEIILGQLSGLRAVGLFHGPYQVVLGLSLIPMQMMRSAFPAYSRAYVQSREGFNHALVKGFKVLTMLGLPLSVLLFMEAPKVIRLLLGPRYEPSGPALRILSLAVGLVFVEVFFRFILVAMGKQIYDTWSMAVGVAVNIVLDVALIPWLGFLGACLGTLCAQIVLVLTSFHFLRREHGSFPLPEGWWKIFAAGGLMVTVVSRLGELTLLLTLPAGLLVYGLVLLALGAFEAAELREVRDILWPRPSEEGGEVV